MATFSDFLRQHDGQDPRVRRLYWVCGNQEVFRHLTVDRLKELSGVEPYNVLRLDASEVPETEIWTHLNQHPLDLDQKRMIVVSNAQRLTYLDRLPGWLKDNARGRSALAVFVSTEDDFPEHEVKPQIIRSSGAMVVKCSLPKNEDDRLKRAQEVICAWGNIDRTTAGVLIKRVNFDMGEAMAVMRKAAVFPNSRVNVAAVEILAPRRPEEDIVWALIALNKRQAAEAISDATVGAAGKIIATLAAHVEALSRLNSVIKSTETVREMAHRSGVREGYARMLYPYARLYPRKEAVRRTLLLNRMDRAWQEGAREGVLETLIAQW